MRSLLALAIGLALALLPALARAQDPGPFMPKDVTVEDDPEDDAGTSMIVSWQAPAEILDVPAASASYQIRYARLERPAEPGPVVPIGETQSVVDGLKPWPWRPYQITVATRYDPPQAMILALSTVFGAEAPYGLIESRPFGPVQPIGAWFNYERTNILTLAIVLSAIVLLTIYTVRGRAEEIYIRPIAGLEAVNDAVGRATEMGKPMVYVSGLSGIGDIATIAAMLILGHLSRRAAAYESDIIVPCQDPMVMAAEREIVRQAYTEAGKPDAYKPENIFFVTDSQFGYVAAVDGIMLREQPAACFYMGFFFAEALILAETGNQTGAIQIAGTDADTQLPFFITACDYTLMGEELYAASAYLSRHPLLVAQLRGQDIAKSIIAAILVVGVAAATWAALAGEGWVAEKATAFVEWFAG